jgi:hypothetical protein
MELNTQSIIRIVIPGLIIYVCYLFWQCINVEEFISILKLSEISITDGWTFILIIVAGTLYHIIGIRNIIWYPIKNKLQNKVEQELLQPFSKEIDNSIIIRIKENRKIIYHVLYPLANIDENLKFQSKRIFFNGAILTSIIDFICIFLFLLAANVVKILIIFNIFIVKLIIFQFSLILLSVFLLYFVVKKHFMLSKEETDYLVSMRRDDLYSYIEKLINNLDSEKVINRV